MKASFGMDRKIAYLFAFFSMQMRLFLKKCRSLLIKRRGRAIILWINTVRNRQEKARMGDDSAQKRCGAECGTSYNRYSDIESEPV